MKQDKQQKKNLRLSRRAKWVAAGCGLAVVVGLGAAALLGAFGSLLHNPAAEAERIAAFWPEAFELEEYQEPPFEDDANRTNNAFNVKDFGEQGTNGWFYRYGDAKKPQRSRQIERFDGEAYAQMGANGLEIKSSFLHTSEAASPILEWRVADNGSVNVLLTYVKNVNGDANPGYPDGVQLLVYKGSELLKLENVAISTTEELLTQIRLDAVDVLEGESLYFVVSPRSNNAFDGGSLYIDIRDVNTPYPTAVPESGRKDNNANSQSDFGEQGKGGWCYLCGTDSRTARPVSHEADGGYIDSSSPNLSISQGFIHPSINHNAILSWTPAVNGDVDLRVKYSKYEQHDGNPDFPDGVRVKVYQNDKLLYEEHVDAPEQGENSVSFRSPRLPVTVQDRLYFVVDAEGNASYDGGAFDITVIDVNGATTEADITVSTPEIRQNFANVATDFGPQGSNGWFFQSGYADEPFNAYNIAEFDQAEDRYFHSSWLEIKRDYVNPGEHGRSAVIKWKVAQNGTISIKAAYTKLLNQDANPDWPDGTRVSLYHNNTLLRQEQFAPDTDHTVTKRLDVSSLSVRQNDYITMVVNGLDNIAYDGGNYEFAITSLSGLVGLTERDVPATPANRVNFASTKDDFGPQGTNGWYYQFGYQADPFLAANVERYVSGDKYLMSDGIEIKKDYIVPAANGKSANVKWVVAQTGRINIDLEYTKLKNEDANPSWPDGVTVYLMHNRTVLRKVHFPPYRDREQTKSLAVDGLSVTKGDCITMLVDPGANAAYDGGKYMFVIEDADKTPAVKAGNWDNDTSLRSLSGIKQGTDGWFFLEGRSPADAKVLTKMNDDGTVWLSRRTDGLEMKNGYVHTGVIRDPIYQFVAGETGGVDISGEYMKFGHQDSNPDWPDGVTLKIWHNDKLLQSKKILVLPGDGNNNTASFSFDGVYVTRGDKLSFQICADGNNAWDAGQLSAVIEPSSTVERTPGDDNNTNLEALPSIEQGTDGWWFLEGTTPANAKLLTKMNADKTGYISQKTDALEMKRDYVHPGASLDAIYQWIAADDQDGLKLEGSYVKFGHQDANPDWPDGVTLKIWHNKTLLLEKKVKALAGDGNDNVLPFDFADLKVKAGDAFSFQISSDSNSAWDAGRLTVRFGDGSVPQPEIDQVEPDPNRTNSTGIPERFDSKQGYDGWYYGACDWDSKNFTMLPFDADNQRYYNNGKPELKKDYVEPGNGKNAAYKWIVAEDGTIVVDGEYVKFANSDDPNADGTCVRIFLNGEEKKWLGDQVHGNFSGERKETFHETYEVKAGDELIFAVNPEGNDSYDGGRLTLTIRPAGTTPEPEPLPEPEPDRDNHTVLAEDFSGTQGKSGWYYGSCEWDSKGFNALPYDAENERYYNNGKPELKKDYVEPGSGKNAAYKWIVAKDGTIRVTGEYVKFANSDDPNADGTCVRIFLNGEEKKWMGDHVHGNFAEERREQFDEVYAVKAGDELLFAVNPEGNDAWDGGRLSVTINPAEEPGPGPEPETDKSDLRAAIDAARALNAADYTEASWEKLAQALEHAAAVCDDAEATQDEIDAAKDALRAACDALETKPGETGRTNRTVLAEDFTGTQGKNGWYYGACDWDSKNFTELGYEADNERYYNNGKPELKKDYVEPGNGKNAAYKWIAAEDGTIRVSGEYVKFSNSSDANADGVCVRIFLNGVEKKWMGDHVHGNFSEERKEVFDETYEVKAGDALIFAVNPEGNDAWDGGRLSVTISPAEEPGPGPDPEPETDKTGLDTAIDAAKALRQDDYTEASWAKLADALRQAEAVRDNASATQDEIDAAKDALNAAVKGLEQNPSVNKTELKTAIRAAEALSQEDYTEASWKALAAALKQAKAVYDDAQADQDAVDAAKQALTDAMNALQQKPDLPARTNQTVLAEDFTGTQGKNGWYYGACDWDSKGFNVLTYDAENERYYNSGKPELKKDFVEPGNGKNAAYKWVVAEDGTICVSGEYVKFANSEDPNADGVCVRIFLNGVEKKWMGDQVHGNFAEERREQFNEVYEVKAGDELIFAVNPEGNDSWDGGRLSVTIGPNQNTEPEIDKSALSAAIAAARALNQDDYTEASWAKLTQALEQAVAVYDDTKATQDEIDAAKDALNTAADELEQKPEIDKTGLKTAIDAARALNQEDYTEASWTALAQALEQAEVVYQNDSATQDEIDAAKDALNNAVEQLEQKPVEPARTNNTVLADEFTGTQGKNGWYYGACDWDSKNFTELPYDAENQRYYNNGKPELKKDFVEPGGGKNAAYKWVAAQNGSITVVGEYVKFANSDDPNADGVCVRIFLNGVEKKWMGDQVHGNFAEERKESFRETYDVKAGDELIFAVNPEGNDAWDGGRLTVAITPKGSAAPEADKSGLRAAIEAAQALQQDAYTESSWAKLAEALTQAVAVNDNAAATQSEVDAAKNALNAALDALEQKPVVDKQALQAAVDAANALNREDYTESSWTELAKALEQATAVLNDEAADQTAVDEAADALQNAIAALEKKPVRTNNTVLADDFSGTQGKNGWYYGACDWDGKNFSELSYDADNQRYYNNGKPELKRDFVEPGGGRNAAYKWVVAQSGTIVVSGEYVKFANSDDPNADGTCVRIFLNGVEKKWMGSNTMGNFAEERKESFYETYTVQAGDVLIFAVNPEGNDAWDGGRLSVTIRSN